MAKIGEVDTKKQTRTHVYEDTHAEWKIPDFSSLSEYSNSKSYDSPAFSVKGVSFFFKMYPTNSNHPDGVCFFLESNFIREFSVEYNFGLEKNDGSVKQLRGGIMRGDETCCIHTGDVSVSEVLCRKSELVPGNVLTLTCTLKPDTIHSTTTTELDNPKELKLKTGTHTEPPHLMQHVDVVSALRLLVLQNRLERLSKNFRDIFGDKDTCDTTLKVKEKEFKAHRLILMARSAVFAATFKHDTLERQTGVITISDCDPDSFQLFLDYLYSGQLEELSYPSALNLYYTSDKYDVTELKESCLEYLMQCLTVENVCQLAIFADKQNEKELFSAVQGFFNQNIFKILSTSDWDDLLMKDPRLANKLLKELSKVKLRE